MRKVVIVDKVCANQEGYGINASGDCNNSLIT